MAISLYCSNLSQCLVVHCSYFTSYCSITHSHNTDIYRFLNIYIYMQGLAIYPLRYGCGLACCTIAVRMAGAILSQKGMGYWMFCPTSVCRIIIYNSSSSPLTYAPSYHTYHNLHPPWTHRALLSGVKWPDDVDKQNRERHLSDEEFYGVFNMTKEAFKGLDRYKQTQKKKDHRLW